MQKVSYTLFFRVFKEFVVYLSVFLDTLCLGPSIVSNWRGLRELARLGSVPLSLCDWKYENRTPGVYQHLYLKKTNTIKKNNHFHSIFKAFAMCAKNINRGNRKEQICVHIGCFEKSNRIVALKASQCRGPIFPTKD